MEVSREQYDVVIIGSGGAGLRAALAAAERGVRPVILTKGQPQWSGGTLSAHYSFCAVLPTAAFGDSPEVFARDILRSGEGISDPKLVRVLAERSGEAVAYAQRLGVKFDPAGDDPGVPHLGWLAGHTYPRAVHVGNAVGRELIRVLLKAVRKARIPIHAFTSATDLVVEDGELCGVAAYHIPSGELRIYEAPAVILATGGGSQIYELNTNPVEATGDGYGIALRAGAELMDMEFVQFYPTVFVTPAGARGLMFNSGILVPKGARLLNRFGEDFWDRYGAGPLKDATRDVMTRVMSQEIAAGGGTERGGLYITVRGLDPRELPQLQQKLLEDVGVDPNAQEHEVAPGAHYFMGGIRIDEEAATKLPGLYAAGECTGGIHGANRLAGNALSENQVFGAIAGQSAAQHALRQARRAGQAGQTGRLRADAKTAARVLEPVRELISRTRARAAGTTGDVMSPGEGWQAVRSVMQRCVGATRTEEQLKEAIAVLEDLRDNGIRRLTGRDSALPYNRDISRALDLRNMIDTGWSVAVAALERRESRGAHVRLDAPERDEAWTCSLAVRLSNGQADLRKYPRGEVKDG
mgnify:FL=1